MLKAITILLLGIILTSCASTKSTTFKGDMPYVEGTPTHELLKDVLS